MKKKKQSILCRPAFGCLRKTYWATATAVVVVMLLLQPWLYSTSALAFSFKRNTAKNAQNVEEAELPFVPAFVSPNGTLQTTGLQEATAQGAFPAQEVNVHSGDADVGGTIHLNGVTPNKTLDALRTSPKPNATIISTLSIKQSLQPAMPATPVASAQQNVQLQAGNTLTQLQQDVAEEDLKRLWMATIERNPVVRFALEKISLPAERHFSHSSEFMRKTLSVLVSGAAMASTLVAPTSGYQNMSVMTGGQIAQNYLSGRNKPISDLTPTEHIQLSYLIDELKESLVEHYHHYQQSLVRLNELYAQSATFEADYVASKKNSDPVLQMLATQHYFNYRNELLHSEQKARLARTQLERIAGAPAVDGLALLIRPEASRLALQQSTPEASIAKAPQTTVKAPGANASTPPAIARPSQLPLAGDIESSMATRRMPSLKKQQVPALMDDIVSP